MAKKPMEMEKFRVQRKNSIVIDTGTTIYTLDPKSTHSPKFDKGTISRIVSGTLLMFLSISSLIYTPFDFLMTERLRMLPGFPAYDWWLEPPDEVLLKVYIFNVTNADAFMNGDDKILQFSEIGPLVYREKLRHTNVTFNSNGTMTYTAHRTAILLPELSNVSYDDVIVVPNLAILAGASYLADNSFITKIGFNMLVAQVRSPVFSTIRVYDYLWNWTDPLVDVGRKFMPSMVPVSNLGVLHRIYSDFVDSVTVHIGPKNGHKFFLIDQFRGSDRLGYWDGIQCDNCQGSTEGVCYPQFLSRNDTIHYLRKTVCRVVKLHYAYDITKKGMTAYRWELPLDTYHRTENRSQDCYTLPGDKSLPSGVSDVSPCYYHYPIATSLPHFLGTVEDVSPRVTGMTPDAVAHGSYVVIEPLTGIPMESRARSQSNLVVKRLSGFSSKLTKFSDMILPMFWLEYGQQDLPWYVSSLMYFTVIIVPNAQHWFSLFMILGAFYLLISGFLPYFIYLTRQIEFRYYKFEKIFR